jgi:hypothetical protein
VITATDEGPVERPKLVTNRVAECCPEGYETRPLERNLVDLVVIHKTSVRNYEVPWNEDPVADEACDARALAERFRRPNPYTSGRVPYHFLVLRDGAVEQMLALSMKGTHAIDHNWRSWGVAYLGETPTGPQGVALVRLVGLLAMACGETRVMGHTALPGASKDPNKVCPGKIDVPMLAKQALAQLPSGWQALPRHQIDELLVGAGVAI